MGIVRDDGFETTKKATIARNNTIIVLILDYVIQAFNSTSQDFMEKLTNPLISLELSPLINERGCKSEINLILGCFLTSQ